MATPLYTFMKDRGTTIYVMPSASRDISLGMQNPNISINFNKFVLLNFPKQEQNVNGQDYGKMNFSNYQGDKYYSFKPGSNGSFPGDIPDLFSEQLVESLRNYVANQDEVIRTSRINSKDDFYSLGDKQTNSEKIFWKWCRKMNLLDLEPAKHKIDWDKNLTDFNNVNKPNESTLDFFQEYLWKERDINVYSVEQLRAINATTAEITVNQIMKIRVGDNFIFEGTINLSGSETSISTGISYEIVDVQTFEGANKTIFRVNDTNLTTKIFDIENLTCYLDYERFIQYVGEVSSQSKIETSKNTYTEITAHIPHHVGRTPYVLFEINDNNNYYPDLTLPLLPEEIQEEIVGAENLQSPIRQNPENYPGSFYGLFDTEDKTYKASNGDRWRKSGEYYGVLRTNNVGLDDELYIETLEEFNSDNIDGLGIDFDTSHYYKMNLPTLENTITNFDEFNSYKFNNEAPSDFEFNAILWYYEINDGTNSYSNLYGIEFLNNPNDDFDDIDPDGQKIRPFQKLVSNGEQDGISYIYNLNISYRSDNDVSPLAYSPTTQYNDFGFDLYQNILQTNYNLQENLVEMVSGFTVMQDELQKVKSLVYTQQQYDVIQERLNNLDELVKLYKTMKLVDSNSVKVETNYGTTYPTTKLNVVNSEYANINNLNVSDIRSQNIFLTNDDGIGSLSVVVPEYNKLLVNIYNDVNEIFEEPIRITLSKDLKPTQMVELIISPENSSVINSLEVNINWNNGSGTYLENLFTIDMPTDLLSFDSSGENESVPASNNYLNDIVYEYSKTIDTTKFQGKTLIYFNKTDAFFSIDDVIYIDNFYLNDPNGNVNGGDFSGAYKIEDVQIEEDRIYYKIDLSAGELTELKGILKISNYNGMKIQILRVTENQTDNVSNRYKITKELL
jgi:hypothetical protein